MNKSDVRIGLVGMGGMGQVHYHNWSFITGAKVTALVGHSMADRQRADEWKLPLYSSITAMCQSEAIDLVDICTPTFLHKHMVLEALDNRKHTLIEKPIALNLQDAQAMYQSSKQNQVQLYVAHVVQFTKESDVLRKVVREQVYGKPLDACFERLSAYPQWASDSWMIDKSKSGLIPYDLHIHDLDLIISLFGLPKTMSYTSAGDPHKHYREQYRFSYSYEGLTVCAEAAWFNAAIPFTARWRVYFEQGMLICDQNGVQGYSADGTRTDYDVTDEVQVPTGINIPPTAMFYHELSHFAACARSSAPSPLVTQDQVLGALTVLEQMGF